MRNQQHRSRSIRRRHVSVQSLEKRNLMAAAVTAPIIDRAEIVTQPSEIYVADYTVNSSPDESISETIEEGKQFKFNVGERFAKYANLGVTSCKPIGDLASHVTAAASGKRRHNITITGLKSTGEKSVRVDVVLVGKNDVRYIIHVHIQVVPPDPSNIYILGLPGGTGVSFQSVDQVTLPETLRDGPSGAEIMGGKTTGNTLATVETDAVFTSEIDLVESHQEDVVDDQDTTAATSDRLTARQQR